MPFGFGKKKEDPAKEAAAQPQQAPPQQQQQYGQPPPQQHYGQPQQQQHYGQPPPQQHYGQPPPQQQHQYGGQPQYGQPAPQYGSQPQYDHQPQQQQQQYGQPTTPQGGHPPQNLPPVLGQQQQHAVTGTPAKQGEISQQVGGHTEPVVGTPIYGDDVNCNPIVKRKFIKQGCKDVWAVVIFLIQLLVTIFVAIYNSQVNGVALLDFGGEKTTTTSDLGNSTTVASTAASSGAEATRTTTERTSDQERSLIFFFVTVFVSVLLAVLMMVVMRLKPVQFIWVANIICICLYLGIALWVIVCCGAYVMALILVVSAAIHAFVFYRSRGHIPFVACLLKQALKTTHTNFGTYICSFAMVLALIVYLAFFSLMAIPTLQDLTHREVSADGEETTVMNGGAFFITLLLILVLFWTVQVMINIVHTTACGSVATWFYAGDDNMPPVPTVASAKRAMTTSLGSICFGSLLVAILQTIQFVLRSLMARGGGLCACVAACIIGCIESLLRYFNEYAFCYVAVYGMGYTDAAKATFDMLKTSVWGALFNDWITGVVLSITALLDSILIGLIFWALSGSFILGVACFVVSYTVHLLLFRVASSAITTVFVCITEDEAVLQQSNPIFYAELQAARVGVDPGQSSQV